MKVKLHLLLFLFADGAAFVLAVGLIGFELRHLSRGGKSARSAIVVGGVAKQS